jgi:hypothetical protein
MHGSVRPRCMCGSHIEMDAFVFVTTAKLGKTSLLCQTRKRIYYILCVSTTVTLRFFIQICSSLVGLYLYRHTSESLRQEY